MPMSAAATAADNPAAAPPPGVGVLAARLANQSFTVLSPMLTRGF
jgi:hypothetical protein